MRQRDVEGLIARWQGRGLLSDDQAAAIRAYEAEARADEPPDEEDEPAFDVGALLSYGGALVALGAVMGLYATLFDDIGHGGRIPVTWGVALGAAALAWVFSRARGGSAAADATGFATTILLAWAVLELFDAIGWFGDRSGVDQDGYLRDLTAAFQALAAGARQGTTSDVRPGYLKCLCGSHVVYYRNHPDRLDVIRVLHQRQDADRNL